MPLKILVTGGAGFIGSNLVRHLVRQGCKVLNLDKLTYAGNLASLADLLENPRHRFGCADICDAPAVQAAFQQFRPDAVMHLAAESHVDRSIDDPTAFIQTNIAGTFTLLQTARAYWENLPAERRRQFRFLHVSTDEVFGSLAPDRPGFTETTAYAPRSPYSASKASADHLVRAWHHTYGLPVLVTHCSNNYGPYQFPEKLIPTVILKALRGEPIPVYGQGENVRDWLYVADHVKALWRVLTRGQVGETYGIGGNHELPNLHLVRQVCRLLDELNPEPRLRRHEDLIDFVDDRPGHDLRYAIDASKIRSQLGWAPDESLESGLRKTVGWYLENRSWWQDVLNGSYRLERLGRRRAGEKQKTEIEKAEMGGRASPRADPTSVDNMRAGN